jgi:hypothetical protein
MSYVPKLLSRLTPGEIGRDQAVIDYFYNDPETEIDKIMSIGFFDKAGYLFYNPANEKTYQRIHIRAARGSPFAHPGRPARFQAVISDVAVTSPAGATPITYKVSVSFGQDTSEQIDSTPGGGAFLNKAWHCFFTKYEGIVRFVSNGSVGNETRLHIPSRYPLGANDFVTATLIGGKFGPGSIIPTAGDNIVSAYLDLPSPTIPGIPWEVALVQTGPTSNQTLRAWVTVRSPICKFI